MLSTLATLIAVAAIGLMFSTTRWMGIAAIALLTFRYPVPALMALAVGLVIFIFIRKH